MTFARSIKTGLLALLAGGVIAASIGATVAHAESAWWGLTLQARPTYLQPGKTAGVAARDEVQDISVSAESGAFYLIAEGHVAAFLCSPSPEAVQARLEQIYGNGNVEVPKGECNAAGSDPYEVVFTGKLADKPEPLIQAHSYPGFPLKGGREEVVVSEMARGFEGVSSGQVLAVVAANIGDAPVTGAEMPITITDTLPTGVKAYEVEGWVRGVKVAAMSCTVQPARCTYTGAVMPYWSIEMTISVNVEPDAQYGTNEASVSGGQTGRCEDVATGTGRFLEGLCLVGPAPIPSGDFEVEPIPRTTTRQKTLRQPLAITNEEMRFGVDQYAMDVEAEGGGPFMYAGGHPFQLTTSIAFNTGPETVVPTESNGRQFGVSQPAMPRNLAFKLPRGLIGNSMALPQCTDSQFTTVTSESKDANECPADSAVGVAIIGFVASEGGAAELAPSPIFNLVPAHGEPARFGFMVAKNPVILDTSVQTGGDYGVTVTVRNTTESAAYMFSQVVFWGWPGATTHRLSRGWECLQAGSALYSNGACDALKLPGGAPFLTMPTSCAIDPLAHENERLVSQMEADSWAGFGVSAESLTEPLKSVLDDENGEPLGLTGCNGLAFEPDIKEAVPDVKDADTQTGLTVDVHVPQEAALNPSGVADSAVKQIEVSLPEGMTVNPGGADGLTSCSEQQIGYKGESPSAIGGLEFTPDTPFCPDSSKIATVTIHTPLLPSPLEGSVYLATPSTNGEPGDNPYNSLIAMYLVAKDPVSGVLVKLPMRVELNPTTGQLVTTVDNPELPFEDAELHFFGGSRAPLATPAMCGTYTTKAIFTPWSGNAPVDSNATFTIDTGPGGGSCLPSPRPFAPTFQAGTANLQAGGYTPLTTTLGHPDGNQYLGNVSMKLPPGLMGSLSGVKLCPEPQANAGTCGAESLIGHTTVTAGLGSNPAVVARPGNVYITGPYNGHGTCNVGEPGCAPFGLTIANPAETGPFDLEKSTPCDCVVVRAKIEINPITAQLTVTSDPLPTILKGIPLQLQHVNVTIERPNFTLNPTNCAPLSIDGTIGSAEGATAPVSTHFQVANCATLGFKPKFKASTPGKTSRKNGAGLDVKLVYPKAPFGSQANIANVKVDLPKQLPSRLETLKRACVAATFEANPSACPSASRVGYARAITPVLPVPLEGPAYFVSYGAAKFPELIIVLQGYGVIVDLHGETFISKAGITSSTFRMIPDVPVGSFELKLPQGPYSALAANTNLCKASYAVTPTRRVRALVKGRSTYVTIKIRKRARGMQMPTAFTAQNGMVIHTSTQVSVTGCSSSHKSRKAHKASYR